MASVLDRHFQSAQVPIPNLVRESLPHQYLENIVENWTVFLFKAHNGVVQGLGCLSTGFRPCTSGSFVASLDSKTLEFKGELFYLLRYPKKFSFYEFFILKKFIWRKILFTIKIRKFKTLIQTRPWFFKVIWLSEFKFFQYFKRFNFCIFLQTRVNARYLELDSLDIW